MAVETKNQELAELIGDLQAARRAAFRCSRSAAWLFRVAASGDIAAARGELNKPDSQWRPAFWWKGDSPGTMAMRFAMDYSGSEYSGYDEVIKPVKKVEDRLTEISLGVVTYGTHSAPNAHKAACEIHAEVLQRAFNWMTGEPVFTGAYAGRVADYHKYLTERAEWYAEELCGPDLIYAIGSILLTPPWDASRLDASIKWEFIKARKAAGWKPGGSPEAVPAETTTADKPKLSWQEAAERLERLRSQGEKFKSQGHHAKEFECSSSTVHTAIHNTPSLAAWAKPKGVLPAVCGLTDVTLDNYAQAREPDPSEVLADEDVDLAFAKLLNEAEDQPALRAQLHEMPPEKRRALADLVSKDPDASDRVWTRQ